MLPSLTGSYEETPPCLIDLATRDRRWAQGNLQHIKIVGAKGLHWVSRVHLIQGIMSYLASPMWLMLLLAGLMLATVARYTMPNYFPETFSLFPVWPVFDPELALRLFAITFGVLYLPKLLALVLALTDRDLRKGCGGTIGLLKSLLAETFLSMLLSPIMMLIQSRFVLDVLLGRDSGWNAQNRDDQAMPLAELEKETLKWCREMLAHSPIALRCLKAALNADCDGQMGLLDLAGNATLLYYMSEEGKEGKQAFLEKRPPDFSKFPRVP